MLVHHVTCHNEADLKKELAQADPSAGGMAAGLLEAADASGKTVSNC